MDSDLQKLRLDKSQKAPKTGGKSSVNFTRIKRHMKENQGSFMVIASVAFDPAVVRDAEQEGATLVPVDTLVGFLDVHHRFVFPPDAYVRALSRPGLAAKQAVEVLVREGERLDAAVIKNLLLIDALDFAPRTADEIKGRLDLLCEQRGTPEFSRSELETGLAFLASPLLGVVRSSDQGYGLAYLPAPARDRLRAVLRALCH